MELLVDCGPSTAEVLQQRLDRTAEARRSMGVLLLVVELFWEDRVGGLSALYSSSSTGGRTSSCSSPSTSVSPVSVAVGDAAVLSCCSSGCSPSPSTGCTFPGDFSIDWQQA